MVGISFGSVQTILKEHLGLRRVNSRLVSKFLNFFEKDRRVQACEAMTIKANDQSSEYRLKGKAKPKKPHQSGLKITVFT